MREGPLTTEAFKDGSVHLWMADLDSFSMRRAELESHLNRVEQERATQLRPPHSRNRFVIGRGYLREILSRCIGVSPASLAIANNPYGKPFLPIHGDWHFNIAHSGNLALFAVSYGREVGVDIERIRPEISPESLAPRVLCEREHYLLSQQENAALPLLLQFWTLKEAWLKANGCGLSIPLSHIDVSDANGQISLWDSQNSAWHPLQHWRVYSLDAFPNCIAAIAARGHECKVTRHEN